MPRALIDTTVLFAAAYTRDSSHDAALPVLQGIDDGALPEPLPLWTRTRRNAQRPTTHAGHDAAVDLPINQKTPASISTHSNTDASRRELFRQHGPLSFVDTCIIAYMQTGGLGYINTFDDDFGAAKDVYR